MLRAGAPEPWQPLRDHLGSASLGTLVLLAASVAFTVAVRAARAGRVMPLPSGLMAFLFASVFFAFAFCANKASDYFDFFEQHLGPAANTQMATYFLLTGVHLLHVVGGILVSVWLMLTASKTWREAAPVVINRLEATALYWYFVDVVWLIMLVLLYVA